MVFDPRNGLAPDTQYEIVTYGSLNEAATTEVPWPLISNARTGEKAKEISKSQIPNFPNFLGLVLGCIEAKFCK